MSQNSSSNKDTIINLVELYLSKWKLILVCVLIALAFAFLKIRYSTSLYQATATIKLKEDENSRSLAEISSLQNGGLGSTLPNVTDEIQVIKSRTILTEVVKDLKLNIRYFVSGKVKQEEVYSHPPVNISFFMNDSLVGNINKSLHIKILSAQKFELSNINTNKLLEFKSGETSTHSFGERVKTSFGSFVLTPNLGTYGSEPGAFVEIRINPIHSVVQSYRDKIKLSTTEKSNVIQLSLNESIMEKARLVLDKVIEKYNADVVNDKEQIVQTTSEFITNRLNIVSNELEQVDFTAEKLQKDNRLTALSSQSNIFLESERLTDAKINETSNQLQLVEYMSENLNDENRESDLLPDIAIGDSDVAQITKNINELVLQRDQILKNSSDKNPTVVRLNDQINALKGNLNQSLGNIKSANEITLRNLNRQGSRIRGQIYSAPGKERQFRDIKRQQDIKESLYLYLLEKREETAITLGMSTANAKVVDYAYTNADPVAPKQKVIYLASLLIGLFIPVSLIYAKDLVDNKIHTKEDILRLVKAPFIGDIPKSELKQKVVNKVDYSPKAEAFRILRTNIDFMLQKYDKPCKTVFVTSTTAQEGKSHTTTNLASSFSFSDKKTLLIETDIRVPRVNDYLNIKADKGLTDFISDKSLNIADVTVKQKDNPFLDVIPSGTVPPNPAELLMSDRVNFLFEKVKKEYDYIIVDTAAVGLVTDTLLISDHADIFIYVVSANNIDKRQLHIAQTMYEEKRLPNMVTLLNGSVKKKGYGYGYGDNPQKNKKWYAKLLGR
ncbi:tyrosine-protein kinase family protein [Psychroserpens sp. SPM9]|uniref:GumC family protein n=1 Tax=Psychroserpens sp. SPM9 TaxID=2975598 RepID=UPI0021A49264|nr:tyrosine-protein kinase family protein [Psychroserpens sp. SPM9]MDG5491666.1 polysaccharide biosynthesis tyrosine autokinase [Psychroserpens sp. SPM9]